MEQNNKPKEELSEIEKYKTRFIDEKIKNNKTIAVLAGAVVPMSAATAIGNIIVSNYQIAVQNTGTMLAMIAYTVGNYLMYKQDLKEREIILKDSPEDFNMINLLKNKLELLKVKIKQSKIQQATMAVASTGFITSFASSLFMEPTQTSATNSIKVIVAALTGVVGVACAATAIKQKSTIDYYKLEMADTEEQLNEEITEEQPIQKTLK